ncbi:hypothetical protein [Mycobacterium sp. 1245852.3]|uniref:hypothetical protein n=1 Tax=Mycobacterium sp. 1245852.3 TaxID=1856860 RepID=UPI0007FDF11F|nr:hypothetical protein [Mycobacterium sp. 1245852.3]OBK20223.1 hypothetical protein A9W96_05210 [Mycobacterium sp. 1245852.3]
MERRPQLDISDAEFYVRDEAETGRRLMVAVDEDLLGAAVSIIETGWEYLTVHLELYELEVLATKLTQVAARVKRELCPGCDSLGMVDGDRGPEFCDHAMVDA